MKTRPCLTERLLMGRKESNQINKQNCLLMSHKKDARLIWVNMTKQHLDCAQCLKLRTAWAYTQSYQSFCCALQPFIHASRECSNQTGRIFRLVRVIDWCIVKVLILLRTGHDTNSAQKVE